jgi:hypothetical protein
VLNPVTQVSAQTQLIMLMDKRIPLFSSYFAISHHPVAHMVCVYEEGIKDVPAFVTQFASLGGTEDGYCTSMPPARPFDLTTPIAPLMPATWVVSRIHRLAPSGVTRALHSAASSWQLPRSLSRSC